MSRIYEALQRAHREREKAQASDESQVELPQPIPVNEEPILAEAENVPEWDSAQISENYQVVETASSPDIVDRSSAKTGFVMEDIVQHPWKPVIASLPVLAERGSGVEQFRRLRSRIYQAHYEAALKTILIGSGMPAEGKSFIAANLAISLAGNTDNRVLLIDGDLRRPTLHTLLGTPNTLGLADFLDGTAGSMDIVQRNSNSAAQDNAGTSAVSNLCFIPSGKSRENSSELVANRRIDELIAAVSPHFDWILIDSPPMLAVADAVDIARATDAVLLVARGAKTPYGSIQRTQAALSNSRILGFVLNALKNIPRSGSYNYNYYYGGAKRAAVPGE